MTKKMWVKKWMFDVEPKTVKHHINYITDHVEYLRLRAEAWEIDENDFTIEDAEMFDNILSEIGYLMEHAKIQLRKSPSGYRVMKEI